MRADQTDRFPIGLERDVFDAESGGGAAIAAAIAEAEKVTVRDYVTDMCALLRPDCRWDGIRQGQARTAAEQILSVSEVAPAESHSEFLAVEAVLLCLLQFPARDRGFVPQLLLEMCRASPAVPPALALGTELLFREQADLDYVATLQLADWFAHHLNEPSSRLAVLAVLASTAADAEPGDRQRLFVARVLEVACASRRQTAPRADGFPPELHALLPPTPPRVRCARRPTATPRRRRSAPRPRACATWWRARRAPGRRRGRALRARAAATAMTTRSTSRSGGARRRARLPDCGAASVSERRAARARARSRPQAAARGAGDETAGPSSSSRSSRSLARSLLARARALSHLKVSHSLGLFDRYRGVLASVTEADEDQHNTLDALAAVWRSSPQHVLLLADALVRRRVLRMTSVVAWVFARENETPFASRRFDSSFSGWELLSIVLDRSADMLSAAVLSRARAAPRPTTSLPTWKTTRARRPPPAAAPALAPEVLEEARDVSVELFGRLVRVLDDALHAEGAGADTWVLATRGILHAVCRKYADMQAPRSATTRSTETVALPVREVLEGLQDKIPRPEDESLRATLAEFVASVGL